MNVLEKLIAAHDASTSGEWWEDYDGFIACGHGDAYRTVADARCDVAPFSDANTEAVILAHNTMPQLLKAVSVLKAVRARVSGEFDCPELVEMGPLSGTLTDILRFCDTALEPLK